MPTAAALFGGSPRPLHNAFFTRLADNGVHLESEYAHGDYVTGALDEKAGRLVRLNPDILIAQDTPSAWALAEARHSESMNHVPIICACPYDPHTNPLHLFPAMYFVKSPPPVPDTLPANVKELRSEPGQLAHCFTELLRLGDVIDPQPARAAEGRHVVILVRNGANRGSLREYLTTRAWFRTHEPDISIEDAPVLCNRRGAYDVDETIDAVRTASYRARIRGVIVIGDTVSYLWRDQIHDFARSELQVPSAWESLPAMRANGELCWGPLRPDAWDQVADATVTLAANPAAAIAPQPLNYALVLNRDWVTSRVPREKIPDTLCGRTVYWFPDKLPDGLGWGSPQRDDNPDLP